MLISKKNLVEMYEKALFQTMRDRQIMQEPGLSFSEAQKQHAISTIERMETELRSIEDDPREEMYVLDSQLDLLSNLGDPDYDGQ